MKKDSSVSFPARDLTAQEWKELKEKLVKPYDNQRLLIDGYKVSIQREFLKDQLIYAVYVNGMVRGRWFVQKTKEARKFYRLEEDYLYSKALRKLFTKEEDPELHTKTKRYYPYFSSFNELKDVLKKNHSLKWLKEENKISFSGLKEKESV